MCIRDRDYAAQLKQKEETVKKLLGKYGPVEHIRGMETPVSYTHLDVYKRQAICRTA